MLVLVAVLWGSTFIFIKIILERMDAFQFLALRATGSVIILGLLLAFRRGKHQLASHVLPGFGLGLLLGAGMLLQTMGLKFTTATNSGFITSFHVVFTPFIIWGLDHRAPAGRSFVAAAVAAAGMMILAWKPGLALNSGDLLTLASALLFAFHIILTGRVLARRPGMDSMVLVFFQLFCVAVISGAGMLIVKSGTFGHLPVRTWLAMGYLVVFTSVFTFVAMTWARRHVSSIKSAILLSLEPVSAAFIAWLVAGEKTEIFNMTGGVLIVAAAIGSIMAKKQER